MRLNTVEGYMWFVLPNFQHVTDDVSLLPDGGEGQKIDVGTKLRYKSCRDCFEWLEVRV